MKSSYEINLFDFAAFERHKRLHELHRKKKTDVFPSSFKSGWVHIFSANCSAEIEKKLKQILKPQGSNAPTNHLTISLPQGKSQLGPPRTMFFFAPTNDPQNWDTQTTGWNQECKQQRHQDSEFYNVKVSHRFTSCGHCTV